MLHQICSVYQCNLCVFLVSSASVGPAFLNLPGSAYINQGRWPKKMGEWGTVILRWEWKSPFSSCGKTFPAVAAGDLSMGLCIFWTLESYVCVCVCCFRDTQECVCANVSVRALFGRGWTEVCVSVGTCLYMNESYAWFAIERQSGVFSSIADTHTHTLDASKSPKCSACVCWDVSQWENTHWQPAAHILLPAGGCDHLQPAHCPLTPGEVSPSSKGLRHSQAWSVGLSAEIVSRVAPHCILGIQS